MPRTFTRADWQARPADGGPGALDPTQVVGVALHWPAMAKPLTTATAVCAALRAWQAFHMDDRGWSDIAYQLAFDQVGNRYELRGLRTQSGANGDTEPNETHGAFLLVLAPGEEPSDAMVDAVRQAVADHRRLFPRSTRIVGHSDIRPEPTACPGPAALAAIRAGRFNPLEDDVTPEDIDKVAAAVLSRPMKVKRDGNPVEISVEQVLRETFQRAERVDYGALADAVIAKLPQGAEGSLTAEQVKQAVKDAQREGTG